MPVHQKIKSLSISSVLLTPWSYLLFHAYTQPITLSLRTKDRVMGWMQRVKSSLSSSPITGSFWAGLATFSVTCPVDRIN